FLEAYLPAFVRSGRRWLRQRLVERNVDTPLTDRQLDALLADIDFTATHPEIVTVPNLLVHIGLLDARERGMPELRYLLLDRQQAEALVLLLVDRVNRSTRVVSETDIPVELLSSAASIEACS